MCHLCNYEKLLNASGLAATQNRRRVLEAIGGSSYPLSAGAIFSIIQQHGPINRVTVYRILDLLVDKGLVDRISTGGRAFCYGPAPNNIHPPHPHFYCKNCGRMDCLNPESLDLNAASLWKSISGRIDKIEVRVDGVCSECMVGSQ